MDNYWKPAAKTIQLTYDKAKAVLEENCAYFNREHVNLSDICSHIIQTVGRFAEKHASDFLYNWDDVKRFVKEGKPGESHIEVFAIRRWGVDGESYFISRINEEIDRSQKRPYIHVERKYRCVLAVGIQLDDEGNIAIQLKDLTDSFISMEPEDVQH